ncbi:PREDICTED: NEDD8-conjugating enzyme Ubc12 isoform X1 [Colobus angolensis palliatus]|uniref:NEDD8-conjugating enzyme Ubc12 isoform X1 n=1 Tax=Colobus angolensis palliatus TaxID=336983 RepID=UPI0005F4CB3F|nr:PREDICTED: NEDD8-conjugating enzyme Ubc12 isoform X1 [Colobus angolensis palliatus]
MNGNTRVQPKEAEPQTPSLSNAGLRRLRRRTTQAGREEPKRAGSGNIRSRGAPEAVADLRAEAAAAAEDDPPIPTRRHRGCRVLLPALAAARSRRDQLSGKRHGRGAPTPQLQRGLRPEWARQKKEEESAGGTKGSSKKASAAQLRIQKDINELNLPKTCDISFSDPDDLLNFKLVICPDEGFYKSGKFVFSFKVGQGYPHDPPKVKCETMVYHPNIDLEGNVCLNILREDWKPVLTINSIIYGLQYLFLEPNPEDPLNKEAAEVLQNNRRLFEQNVQRSMRGGYIGSTYFERCLK